MASQLAGPYAMVDVGASAGLNLLCDRFRMDYGALGATGPVDSTVQIESRVIGGRPPIAERLPSVVSRIGIDRSPIDLADPSDARWLLACVWPDTGRLARTAAAVRLGQLSPPRVLEGDATTSLPAVLADLPAGAVAIVVTTWAFAYFSVEDREKFMRILDDASRRRDIAWLSAEGPGTVAPFAAEATEHDDQGLSHILGVIFFKAGQRRAQMLAYVQEHGAWIDWQAPPLIDNAR